MKQTGQLPTSTSKLGKIHGILVGKHADVTHALVLAAQKAKHGGYGQYGLIYVLQLPPSGEYFSAGDFVVYGQPAQFRMLASDDDILCCHIHAMD